MPPPPSAIGAGPSQGQGAPPSYGGTAEQLSQPSGGEMMSDPKTIITSVYSKIMDIVSALNSSFPGGEDKIMEGMQQMGVGFNEKISRMGTPEPPGPPIAA